MGFLPMIDPYIGGLLHADCISVGCKNILADDITYDNVRLLPHIKSNANECYKRVRFESICWELFNLLAPGRPTRVLFEPMRTFCAPVMVPDTTITFAIVSSVTAAVN